MTADRLRAPEVEDGGGERRDALRSRRDIIRQGIRLAFIAPVVTTFLASEAHAAASRQSCYPTGHVCDLPGQQEPCCNGACVAGVCP
jgi:hypothetical protein